MLHSEPTVAATGDRAAYRTFKNMAQVVAQTTQTELLRYGFNVPAWSRGGSCGVIETPEMYIAHQGEGLGTKSIIADLMRLAEAATDEEERSFYNHIAICVLAMILNDLWTVGATALSTSMHLAVASADWFQDGVRNHALIEGWAYGCRLAQCAWTGGETAVLTGIIMPGAAELSGSAVGIIKPKARAITGNIQEGDHIIFLDSSGLHSSGSTVVRELAISLPKGFQTELVDGTPFGKALLEPTHLYGPLIEACLDAGVEIHSALNITGDGWRRFVRSAHEYTYIIDSIPFAFLLFTFIQERSGFTDYQMYETFNMGLGYALFIPPSSEKLFWEVKSHPRWPFLAMRGGRVEKGPKRVVIRPLGIEYP